MTFSIAIVGILRKGRYAMSIVAGILFVGSAGAVIWQMLNTPESAK
jgi:hypothetical protein